MSDQPKRIQRKRTRGWRLPPHTKCVTRPTKWGNRFDWQQYGRAVAVRDFNAMVNGELPIAEHLAPYPTKEEIVRELGGWNLACYCPLDQPCHADVLLEIANAPT